MSNKRKIIDVETKCRFCLGDEGYMSYLFDEILLNKVENITKCTSIVIKENEDLPDKICHICMYKLDTWNEFKEQFIKSNEILLSHLRSDESEDLISETNNPKRKHDHSEGSGAENLSESVLTKKSKHDEILSTEQPESAEDECVDEDFTLKDEIPEDESRDLSEKENPVEQEQREISESIITVNREEKDENKEIESKSEGLNVEKRPTLIPMRFRHLVARRGKTTARRRASTRRWVARKRALLAETGGYGSDTDSIISDNESKLSPVQKARAKTNADKEVDKQKKLARALKNLQTDMKGEYGFKYDSDTIIQIPHSDSEANKHQTRSQKKLIVDKTPTNDTKANSIERESILNENEEIMNEKENNSKENDCDSNSLSGLNNFPSVNTRDENNKSLMEIESSLNRQPIKSEIKVGEAIYIVTSTLVLPESHYLNKTDRQNASGDINGALNSVDDDSQERNTDIIDAVQLRRINNPKSMEDEGEKRNVERCLNIEVEGTELEALQKVQAELAKFVEEDMKDKLLSNKNTPADIETGENKPKDSFQSLDQQLKSIVETAIRKNIESSLKTRKNSASKVRTYRNQKVSTYSPAFVKAAMKSKMFQPRVLLMRLDLGKVRKRYKINNISSMEYQKSNDEDAEDGNRVSNEMQNDSQLGYPTFNIIDSGSDDTSDDEIVTSTPRVYKRNSKLMSEASKTNKLLMKKLSGPKGRKKLSISEKVLYALRKGLVKDLAVRRIVEKPICETVECDTTTKTLPLQQSASNKKVKFSKNVENRRNESEESNNPCKYTCNICDKSFPSSNEKEEHSKSHISRVTSVASNVTSKAKKPRMMRCKRCHEVVDARLVRVHTCRSTKFHKCYVCNASFRSEKSLISHLETHDESEFNIESIERGQSSEKLTNVTSTKEIISQSAADSNTITAATTTTTTATTKTDEYFEKEKSLLAKEEYICFVCDKKFTDEEILKDHLQEHCNDVSEDDVSTDKEQYQCAICGDTLETEDALENHVEKHLCDDKDDNPNLINISNDSDRDMEEREIEIERKEIFKCSQCSKEFDSDILLALHIQVHEEELEIEEWRKGSTEETIRTEEEFFCAICEEAFANEGELSQHLDVHNSNSHVCFLCEQPFLSLEELQIHVASH